MEKRFSLHIAAVCSALAVQTLLTGCQFTDLPMLESSEETTNPYTYTEGITSDNGISEITEDITSSDTTETTEATELTETVETTTEITTEAATDNVVQSEISSGGSQAAPWFDDSKSQMVQAVRGNTFYVPAGFEKVDQRPTSGYLYKYYNDKLDMTISVWDTTIYYLPYDNGDDFLDSNITMYNGYENYSVTYSKRGDDYVVVTGYDAWGKVYYDMFTMQGEGKDLVFEVKFEYGTEHKDECDELVTKFLDNISYSK